MSEEQEIDIKIVSKENIDPSGLLGKIKDRLVARKVKIVDEPEQEENLEDLIKILGDPTVEEITITSEAQESRDSKGEIKVGIESFAKFSVSAQENQGSAQVFMDTLRKATPELLSGNAQRERYTESQWYSTSDLRRLADRWHLPLNVVVQNDNHFLLMLKRPEKRGRGYAALVYDPMQGGERYVELPCWDDSLSATNLIESSVFSNDLGLNQLGSGEYDLSLFGDEDFATDADLYATKTTRVQFDGHNCGPACLFMAALRMGAKKEWNEFKFSGKDQLKKDTGLTVLTREEILSSIRPNS